VLREGDASSRAGATATFCMIAKKNAAAVAPYLRVASRDDAREVRTGVAACLDDLANDDARGAARIAAELAGAGEAAVRTAAAASLGQLAPKARDLVIGPLLQLLADGDRGVRMTALESAISYADLPGQARHGEDLEKALSLLFAQGDADERRLVVRAAARSRATNLLRHTANDADENVRIAAIAAAATANLGPAGLEILRNAVDDRSPMVRVEAISRLAKATGEGSKQVLPVFASMLRSGDPAARRAGALALGDFSGGGEAGIDLLASVLEQRGESVRAAAAEALGRISKGDPDRTRPLLEKALRDPAYDVRTQAIRGLGAIWAKQKPTEEIAATLERSEMDSSRRFVALEALVIQAREGATEKTARAALERVAGSGPPLARLAAQVGRAFLHTDPSAMHQFLEKLLGG
jgi:HEAT repeat protein